MLWEQSCRSDTRIWPPHITYRGDVFLKKGGAKSEFSPSKVTADSSREGENGLSKYDTQGTNNNE